MDHAIRQKPLFNRDHLVLLADGMRRSSLVCENLTFLSCKSEIHRMRGITQSLAGGQAGTLAFSSARGAGSLPRRAWVAHLALPSTQREQQEKKMKITIR
jgi:hypothetical protein